LTNSDSSVKIAKLLTKKRASKFEKEIEKIPKEFEKTLDKHKTAC